MSADESHGPAWIRHLIFYTSLAVVVAVVGGLIWADPPGEAPRSRVMAHVLKDEVQVEGDRHIVPYEVRNEGNVSVEEVQIEVSLGTPGDEKKVEQVIGHLPRGSRRRGTVVLNGPANGGRLEARVIGYQEL